MGSLDQLRGMILRSILGAAAIALSISCQPAHADIAQYYHDTSNKMTQTCSPGGTLSTLSYDSSGNLSSSTTAVPASPGAQLNSGNSLSVSAQLNSSSGGYSLLLQCAGNLVLYHNGVALWATPTAYQNSLVLSMQTDGNLVLYSPVAALWASNTSGNPGAYAVLLPTGNFVIYSSSGAVLWQTNTH